MSSENYESKYQDHEYAQETIQALREIKHCETMLCHSTDQRSPFYEWIKQQNSETQQSVKSFADQLGALISETYRADASKVTQELSECLIDMGIKGGGGDRKMKDFLQQNPKISEFYKNNLKRIKSIAEDYEEGPLSKFYTVAVQETKRFRK